jgi:prepilin-type N-terminal cleavage/methylation domain-containing protein
VKNERGFTLVELIVAVTVFSIGLLALMGANVLVFHLLGAAQRATTAAFYARERLETMRGLECALLSDGSETRGGVYQLVWTVAPATLGVSVRVTVRITYPLRAGAQRSDTIETAILCAR